MELGLGGKVALVTGSSRGIGRGIALALAGAGAKERKPVVVALDLRAEDAPETLVETARREFAGLDILVNNAGSTKRGDFFMLTDADWQDGFALKFFAHVRLARAAWPLLKERGGSLVTIGGTSGRKPHASFTIGSSVNAACAAFSKALADLGKQDGVRVNCIHPSLVETERQWRRIRAEVERTGDTEAAVRERLCRETGITRFGTVEDVADLVTFMVSAIRCMPVSSRSIRARAIGPPASARSRMSGESGTWEGSDSPPRRPPTRRRIRPGLLGRACFAVCCMVLSRSGAGARLPARV